MLISLKHMGLCVTQLNWSWAFEGRVRNAVLGPKEFVCDSAEQSWALKAELGMQCWDRKSLCVTQLN